jgi:glucose/mannose-6-phosphate isomerase
MSLDNRSLIKQFDSANYLSHILDTSEQILEGARLGDTVTIPALYMQAKHIVLLAVGDMLPVALALEALLNAYARAPVVIIQDYTLPHWVSSETLVIAIDYSGANEQTFAAFREAAKQRARLFCLCLEGDLAKEARRVRAPHITLHYGAPARAAFSYMLSALVMILKKLDLIDINAATIKQTVQLCAHLLETIGPEMALYRNPAKQLAEKVLVRQTIIIGSGPLIGVAKKWQLAFASTGKVVTQASTLSEFNDTIINGISYQANPAVAPLVIILQSRYDQPRNKLQQTLLYQVAQAQKFMYEQVFMHPSGTAFGEIMLAGLFGEMVSYYLAWLQERDPSLTEATAFIKEHLQPDTQ